MLTRLTDSPMLVTIIRRTVMDLLKRLCREEDGQRAVQLLIAALLAFLLWVAVETTLIGDLLGISLD
jgi:hypothetical protein